MINIEYLKQLLITAVALSTITCAFVQKTKAFFKKSKHITIYSFFVNIIVSIVFCMSFTDINFPNSLWIGLFSFIGADTVYKTLEGKMKTYTEIVEKNTKVIRPENIINKEDNK